MGTTTTCYAPLLIFCGRHLLAAKLRASNVDPAAGALEELQRIIAHIRGQWPEVEIVVRGDSAYSRDDIMRWCEAQAKGEDVLAHASNARLQRLTGEWNNVPKLPTTTSANSLSRR